MKHGIKAKFIMRYSEKKIFRPLMVLVLVLLMGVSGHTQKKLDYGSNEFKSRTIEINKLSCKITPSFTINENNPEIIKLAFAVNWFDKKGQSIEVPDKFLLFFILDNNFQDYLDDNNKRKQIKPNVNLVNSLATSPQGALGFGTYRFVHFNNNMPPVNIKVFKYTDLPLGMELKLYIGKEKGNNVEIEEATATLRWSFYLPEKKAEEKEPCSEVVGKYQNLFDENKPAFQLSYFETSLSVLEQAEYPMKEVYELDGKFNQFKGNVKGLELVKSQILGDPDYKRCTELLKIVGSIDSYLTDPDKVASVKEKIIVAKTLAKASGDEDEDAEGGGGEAAVEFSKKLFESNYNLCEDIYFQLFDIDSGDTDPSDVEGAQFAKWRMELNSLMESQEAMYASVSGTPMESKYIREYKNFKQYYNESIAILDEYAPEGNDDDQKAGVDEDEKTVATTKKGRKIPWMWILIPLATIAMGFGIYKYLGHIKKAKNASSKVK